jgi:hypothetical protein
VPEVAPRGIYSSRIKVHSQNLETTKGCCSQSQDPTAAPSIQHPSFNSRGWTILTTEEFIQQPQRKTRTWMVSITKGLLGVDKEHLPALTIILGLIGRGYGKTGGNIHRSKLLIQGTRRLICLKNPEIYRQGLCKKVSCFDPPKGLFYL